MNVQDLMNLLKDMDPNAEVRLATQPNHPLAFELGGVAGPGEGDKMACECGALVEFEGDEVHHLNRSLDDDHAPVEPEYDEDEDDDEIEQMPEGVVWLVAGGSPEDTPYAPWGAWDAARSR